MTEIYEGEIHPCFDSESHLVPDYNREKFEGDVEDICDDMGWTPVDLPVYAMADLLHKAYHSDPHFDATVDAFNNQYDNVSFSYMQAAAVIGFRIVVEGPVHESGESFVYMTERRIKQREAAELARKLREHLQDLYHPERLETIDYQLKYWIENELQP